MGTFGWWIQPGSLGRPGRVALTRDETGLQTFDAAGEPGGSERATARLGHLADHLGAEAIGDLLDVPGHNRYRLLLGFGRHGSGASSSGKPISR